MTEFEKGWLACREYDRELHKLIGEKVGWVHVINLIGCILMAPMFAMAGAWLFEYFTGVTMSYEFRWSVFSFMIGLLIFGLTLPMIYRHQQNHREKVDEYLGRWDGIRPASEEPPA